MADQVDCSTECAYTDSLAMNKTRTQKLLKVSVITVLAQSVLQLSEASQLAPEYLLDRA